MYFRVHWLSGAGTRRNANIIIRLVNGQSQSLSHLVLSLFSQLNSNRHPHSIIIMSSGLVEQHPLSTKSDFLDVEIRLSWFQLDHRIVLFRGKKWHLTQFDAQVHRKHKRKCSNWRKGYVNFTFYVVISAATMVGHLIMACRTCFFRRDTHYLPVSWVQFYFFRTVMWLSKRNNIHLMRKWFFVTFVTFSSFRILPHSSAPTWQMT